MFFVVFVQLQDGGPLLLALFCFAQRKGRLTVIVKEPECTSDLGNVFLATYYELSLPLGDTLASSSYPMQRAEKPPRTESSLDTACWHKARFWASKSRLEIIDILEQSP